MLYVTSACEKNIFPLMSSIVLILLTDYLADIGLTSILKMSRFYDKIIILIMKTLNIVYFSMTTQASCFIHLIWRTVFLLCLWANICSLTHTHIYASHSYTYMMNSATSIRKNCATIWFDLCLSRFDVLLAQ